MPSIRELHMQAMDLADTAFSLQRDGMFDEAIGLFEKALRLEQQAAEEVTEAQASEPTRSVLYRSAASLAYNARQYSLAERLVAKGLSGYPSPEIRDQLKDLYEDINFRRHLFGQGMQLDGDSTVRMTLDGNVTSHGLTLADALLTRVDKFKIMVLRTAERLSGITYRGAGDARKPIRDRYPVYLGASEASSFAIWLSIGGPVQQLALLPDIQPISATAVLQEVLKCLRMVEEDRVNELQDRLVDEDYVTNFVGLARELAPDGKRINLVGFTLPREDPSSALALRRRHRDIKLTSPDKVAGQHARDHFGIVSLRGILKRGDSLPKEPRVIVLRADGDKTEVRVPAALMKDVVRSYYEEAVLVTAQYDGKHYCLQDIEHSDDLDNEPPVLG